jgi:DNA-binding MarR family transcriptional regulator
MRVDINILCGMSKQPASSFELARMIGDTCLCLDIQRASRAIGRRFDEAFRPLGLNNWQYSLLMTLNRPAPLTVSGLAERLAMDRTTTTASLKPLERRGLVEVRRDEHDARVRRILLTDAGRAVLDEAVDRWRAANDAAIASLGGTDLGAFRSALRTVAGVRSAGSSLA